MADAGSRRIVCVTGMHRSGTSMVARLLQALGVYLGPDDRLMPARPDNPEGFFEHTDFAEINEAILTRCGASWHDVMPMPAGWECRPVLDDLYDRARAVVERDFSGVALWGWKDPRTCLTLPFWQRLLGQFDTILCVRRPLDVARSLEARDQFPIEKSLMLWSVYTAAAVAHTVERPPLIALYDSYLEGQRVPPELSGWLGLDAQGADAETVARAADALRLPLRHHAGACDSQALAHLPWAVRALHAALHEPCSSPGGQLPVLARAVLEDWGLRVIVVDRERQLREVNDRLAEVLSRERDLRGRLAAALSSARRALRHQRMFEGTVQELDDRVVQIGTLLRESEAAHREQLALSIDIAGVEASATWKLVRAARRVRKTTRALGMQLKGRAPKARRRPRPRPADLARRPLGVNVAGYLAAESGMGEAVRASVRALEAAGVPLALNNEAGFLREHDDSYLRFDTDNPHAFNLVHLNADNMADFARRRGEGYFRDRYTIGFWFWELEEFRPDWRSAFDFVNEVWVATEFTARAIAPHAPARVPVITLPPAVPRAVRAPVGREHFGLPADRLVFLFMFDVSSQLERKNPEGLLRAFREARLGDQACLALKFTNSDRDPEAVRRLQALSDGLPVLMFDGYLSRAETAALVACSDCYISLHRAEGFGLTLAEAMALEKPVIATGYSGNLEFMTPENSLLVDYSLVEIERDYGPYLTGFRWAEPDVSAAARCLRDLAADSERRRALARRGASDIAAQLSVAASASRLRARLEAIREEVP